MVPPKATSAKVPHTVKAPFARILPWLLILALIYLLLIGVSLIGTGFNAVSGGAEGAARIFSFASNPILGVILGTLATALVQSSSTVTSVLVGLVAGGVPVITAIPMIMGANMGTTLTNTIVSLGNIGDARAFRRSFEAATVHDFFNLFSILIFLPVELLLHPLEKAAVWSTAFLSKKPGGRSQEHDAAGPIDGAADFLARGVMQLSDSMGDVLLIVIGTVFIMCAVFSLGKLLRSIMTGRARHLVEAAIGRGPLAGVGSGTLITVLVQSSSTTTSLVVPLAGAGVLTTRQVYPFTLGANVGTCVTALLAAASAAGEYRIFALQIALVHLYYNVCGVGLFLSIPFLRELPLHASFGLGAAVARSRAWALAYIVTVFFALPGAVFLASATRDSGLKAMDPRACTPDSKDCIPMIDTINMRLE